MKSLRTLLTVMRKELRDLFRDRRTVALALGLGPILFPLLMIGIGTLGENRDRELNEKPLQLPVAGRENAPNLIAWLQGQNVEIKAPPADIARAIARQDEDMVLRIAPDFARKWRAGEPAPLEVVHDSSRQDAQVSVARLNKLLATYGSQVGSLVIRSVCLGSVFSADVNWNFF